MGLQNKNKNKKTMVNGDYYILLNASLLEKTHTKINIGPNPDSKE